jgi:hypothetical protein
MPAETLQDVRARLSKQGTEQLVKKLKAGLLFDNSKGIAISILEKRGVDCSEFSDKPTEGKKVIKVLAKEKKAPKEKVVKEPKEKTVKEPKAPKEKKEGTSERKKLSDEIIADIIKFHKEGLSVYKIRVALGLS